MLCSDWLKIRTQNQVNILPPKLIWGGRMLTWSEYFAPVLFPTLLTRTRVCRAQATHTMVAIIIIKFQFQCCHNSIEIFFGVQNNNYFTVILFSMQSFMGVIATMKVSFRSNWITCDHWFVLHILNRNKADLFYRGNIRFAALTRSLSSKHVSINSASEEKTLSEEDGLIIFTTIITMHLPLVLLIRILSLMQSLLTDR